VIDTMTEVATSSTGSRVWSLGEVFLLSAIACAAGYAADDWIAMPAIVILWLAWRYLRDNDGLPILPMAMTFQWIQVTVGIGYFAVTGRRLATMDISDYRPMVLIGLGCIASLSVGLSAGINIMRRASPPKEDERHATVPIGWRGLLTAYVGILAAQGAIQDVAYQFPEFTQAILAFKFVHLAILFIILRRLSQPVLRWPFITVLVTLEVVLGVSGFFAGFREPLVMAVVALSEIFNPRRPQHWIVLIAFGLAMFVISIMWVSVKTGYRREFDDETFARSKSAQVSMMATLSTGWWQDSHDVVNDTDKLIDRLWVVYYPALAVSRVPSVLPHTEGSITLGALQHILSPRVFFPTKAELQNDSEMVNKYSGVHVAGTGTATSIAFGYAAESYIDFGLPWMFIPVFLYGMLAGLTYQVLSQRIRYGELRAGLLAVIFWLSLYLFERSWVKTLGLFGTLVIYLGTPALILDYHLSRRGRRAGADPNSVSHGLHQWSP
jgi:hypothetical protein